MRKLIQGTALLAVIVLVACEEAAVTTAPPPDAPRTLPEPEPGPTQPEPAGPLPVVSFATLSHSTTAGRTVILTINMSPPASQPISINFRGGLKSGSVTAPAGASEAYISIPIPYDPNRDYLPAAQSNILIDPGDGYIVGQPMYHDLIVYHVPNYDPEPDPEYPDETHPLVNRIDKRCHYSTLMPPEGTGAMYPVMLLDRVSSVGTLCATGLASVSQAALDRISNVSTAMLRNRPDLTEPEPEPETETETETETEPEIDRSLDVVILLYTDGESWCRVFPAPYANQICRGFLFQPRGIFAFPLIVCPKNSISICVHEIAHAVGFEQEPVIERFNEPDVAELWSGYGLTNGSEFFAEMSGMYFCVPTGQTRPELRCADELQAYDPDTYEVIHAIYRGSTDLRAVTAKRMR